MVRNEFRGGDGRAIFVLSALVAAWFVSMPAGTEAMPEGLSAEVYVDSMEFPTSMALADNGDILVAEKFGTVRVIRDGELLEEPVAEIRVATQNEAGLVGIEPMPDYADSGEFLVTQLPHDDLEHIYVSKLKLDGDAAVVLEEKWKEFPSRKGTTAHYGGSLQFDDDGYLYIGLGDIAEKERADDPQLVSGSVLRFNADGSIPEDNPFDDTPVYAPGLRNPFGLTVGADGAVWVADNGPEAADEINRIEAGNHYGYPHIEGRCDYFPDHEPCDRRDEYEPPAYQYDTIVAPTGLAQYTADRIPELRGDLIVATWHSRQVHRFEVQGDGRLVPTPPFFQLDGWDSTGDRRSTSSFTDVAIHPDGSVLILEAGREKGRILRVAPDSSDPNGDAGASGGDTGGADGDGAGSKPDAGAGCTVGGQGTPVPWEALGFVLAAACLNRRSQRINELSR